MYQFLWVKRLGKLNILLPHPPQHTVNLRQNQKWKMKRPSSPLGDVLYSSGRKSVWSHFWNYIFNVPGRDQPFCPQEPGISEKQLPAPLWTIVRAESLFCFALFLTNSFALIGQTFLCSFPGPAALNWEVKFFPSPCLCVFIYNMVSKRPLEAFTIEAESQTGQQCWQSYKTKSRERVTLRTTGLLGANELHPWTWNRKQLA